MKGISHFLVVVIYFGLCIAQVPTGCGGFIKPSSELAKVATKKMDYSTVKVKLLTTEGVTKDTTECAPSGYYFLPIYDKGNYVIKIEGPEGWHFEPHEASIQITEDNRCHSSFQEGEDINFSLTGFSIQGKVTGENCQQADEGPSGVTVTLKREPKYTIVAITDKGTYRFTNVFPGPYRLKASHPDWTLSKSEADVVVTWGTVTVPSPFVVSGYDVSGRVTSRDEPVLGVEFLLYSDTVKSVPCENTIKLPENKKAPLCSARSDENGKFVLKNIPCGTYKLTPYYRGANTTFDVAPAEVPFVVSRGSTVLKDAFQVMGFSLSGKVVSQGKGVSDVVIKVDGKERAVTDINGYYKLDQLISGAYNIEASKEHFVFHAITNYKISPNMASIPDITVKSYHVCGRVQVAGPVIPTRTRTLVLLTETDTEVGRSNTDASGHFCFDVASGTYKIFPQISSGEEASGLLLNPRMLKITVSNAPILDLVFTQARVTVSGKVKCIESPCDPSISVSLESSQTRVTTGLGMLGLGAAASGREVDSSDYFVFRDVLPGVYRVTIHKDSWCWEKDTFEVEVKTEDITTIEFTHSGYLLQLKSSHDTNLLFDPESKEDRTNFTLTKGVNKFCVKRSGVHFLQPKSCYKFEQDTYRYDTASSKVLELTVTHYLVKGLIEVQQQDTSAKEDILVTVRYHTNCFSDHSSLSSKGKDDKVEHEDVKPQLVSHLSSGNKRIYEFSYWGKLGDTLEVVPSSSRLLFYPPSRSVAITKSECVPALDRFEARPGLFLQGGVTPPVPSVRTSIYFEDTNEKIKEVYTGGDGTYVVGPLYDDRKYRAVAEKEGYHFEGIPGGEKGNFRALRLSKVDVMVKDQEGQPVSGVLLSLSGNSYRSNNVTQQGVFRFSNLFPGEYYLKPLLKEYMFEPQSQTITITEGRDNSVSFTGARTAFSCYGSIKSLNGDAEKLVTVEALGPKGEYEETQSDVNGTFRLRGLLPNHSYKVNIKQGDSDSRIERASPSFITITVGKQDIHDIEFVVFRRIAKYDITGAVVTQEQWLNTLNVSLYKEGESTPIHSLSLGPSNFFEFSSLSKGNYVVHVSSSLNAQVYLWHPVEQTVNLQSNGVHIQLNFTAQVRQENPEITSTPLFALFLGVVVIVSVFYYDTLVTILTALRSGKGLSSVVKNKQMSGTSNPDDDEWLPAPFKKLNTRNKNVKQ